MRLLRGKQERAKDGVVELEEDDLRGPLRIAIYQLLTNRGDDIREVVITLKEGGTVRITIEGAVTTHRRWGR